MTTTYHDRRCLGSALAACAVVVSSLVASPAQAHGDPTSPTKSAQLTSSERHIVKQATHRFRKPQDAVAAGYIATNECAELPGVGGMGYHYVHPTLAADNEIDPTRPEILVYVPASNGRLTLGAVEYFRPDADQDPTTTDDRPYLFGHHPFDGPMPVHEAGMHMHYDLHVWLYQKNPSGELAAWNPRVHCPSE